MIIEGGWKWIAGTAVAAVGALWGVINYRTKERIDRMETHMTNGFAEARQGRKEIYDRIETHRQEVKADLKELTAEVRKMNGHASQ